MRGLLARHTTWRDLGFAGVFAALAVAETLIVSTAPHAGLRALMAALTCGGLALRRRHPLAAATVVATGLAAESMLLESPDEVGVLLATALASFSLAAYAPTRDLVAGGVLLAMALAVAIVLDPSDSAVNVLPTLMLFLAVPAVIGRSVGRRQRQIDGLEAERIRLEAEAREAVDRERQRIARELHDVVSHAVTLIAVQAEAGSTLLESDPAAARRSLESIGDVSREALGELHRLLALLGGEQDDPPEAGLGRIDALLAGARAAGLRVDADLAVAGSLPAAVDRCAYRIVQEGLTNALRHSAGGAVDLRIDADARRLHVRLDSSGSRHTSAYGGTGRGLAGLGERVAMLGGTLTAGPHANGFRLDAEIPT
ncbi:sensor histidine kinase [Microbacterium rhizophilus]|uniref:sensor histidine kinase n=1 Tax=Microbacterium rhizophilus TaxID=3138934 RepID=UPI0031E4EE49